MTPRLRETLVLTGRGLTYKEIAKCMHISPHTVHFYQKKLRREYDTRTLAGVVAEAFRRGDIT